MNTFSCAFACLAAVMDPVMTLASEGAAGPDQTICGTAALLAADPLAAGESGYWAVLAGSAVFADDQDPTSQVTGLSPGENVLQWTVIGDGPVDIDQMTITVYDAAATVANAGPDSVLCLPVDQMYLLASPATFPAIGSWSSVGIALIDAFTDPGSSVTFPNPGTIQMIWTVFNGTCGQISDTALVTVEQCVIGVAEHDLAAAPVLAFDVVSNTMLVKNVGVRSALEVIDQSGRPVFRSVVGNIRENRILLSGIRPGAYVVRLVPGGPGEALRIVIDH